MSDEKGQMSTLDTPYVAWMRSQDIPVIEGYGVTDLQEHPLKMWERTGVPTSFVHMNGMEGITGMIMALGNLRSFLSFRVLSSRSPVVPLSFFQGLL